MFFFGYEENTSYWQVYVVKLIYLTKCIMQEKTLCLEPKMMRIEHIFYQVAQLLPNRCSIIELIYAIIRRFFIFMNLIFYTKIDIERRSIISSQLPNIVYLSMFGTNWLPPNPPRFQRSVCSYLFRIRQ